MPTSKPGVLVLRPATLAKPLITALDHWGAKVWHFPALTIEFLSDTPQVQQAIIHLTKNTWQIFVSRHAVQAVLPQIIKTWSMLDLKQLYWAAVGHGTAKELGNYIDSNIVYPQKGLGAAALLADDTFGINGKITVWCGDEPAGVWPHDAQLVTCYRRKKKPYASANFKRIACAGNRLYHSDQWYQYGMFRCETIKSK